MNLIETRIAGIPALVDISHLTIDAPEPDIGFPGGWGGDIRICDRKGRPALWLERKLTAAAREQLIQEVLQ